MSGRDLTDEETRMWRAAMRHVRPLPGEKPIPAERRDTARPKGRVSPVPAKPGKVSGASAKAPRQPKPTPQDRSGERRVRRGRLPVSASFDLHGHTQDSAWRLLPQFLSRERARGAQCVIVITGKGRSGEGVLRRNFLRWLELPEAAGLVSGYAPAHSRHGGSGAWYVFLRRLPDAGEKQ